MTFEQFDIDLTLHPIKPKITLHKPNINRTQIANITDLYDVSYNEKVSNVEELVFSIPIDVERQHSLIKNKDVEKIKNRYLIKLTLGNKSKWFQIRKPNTQMTSDDDKKVFTAYSLEIELSDKILRGYRVISKNCTTVLTDILSDTIWNIGYIDSSYDSMYRSFDISSKSILEFILNDLQETFGALVLFNTESRNISVYNPDNIGLDKGLKFSYGKYLRAFDLNYDDDAHATRVIVTGKDGISIQDQNVTGSNFLQDLSFYLFPFERDSEGNIIKSSDYMDDDLCIAILNYNQLLETKDGEFVNLLSQKTLLQETLTAKQNELTALNDELVIILDNLDIANANGSDTTQLIIERDNKQSAINTKQIEIDQVNLDITSVDNQITTLQSGISIENNFTPEQITEMNQFIIQKEISNPYISDSKELIEWAKKEFEKIKIPPIKIDIDIVNFLEFVESQRDWDKLNLFDIVTINVERLNVNVKAKIIEINRNFESGDIKLVISNIQEIQSDTQKFLKDLNKSINTSTTFNMNKYKYDGIETNTSQINDIINNGWDAIKQEIKTGVNESVDISRRGIIIKDPTDPLKYVVMQHGVIALTLDGGNTWKTAIKPDGIVAEQIFGKLGAFAQVRADQIVVGDNGEIISSDLVDALKPNTLYNNVKITSENGVQVFDNNNAEALKIGAIDTTGDGIADIYGFLATHSDGSKTALTQDGLIRIVNGVDKPYNYLVEVGSAETGNATVGYYDGNTTSASNGNPNKIGTVIIQLPNDFKGKNFKIALSVKGGDPMGYASKDGEGFYVPNFQGATYLNVKTVDYVNATFEVEGWSYYYHGSTQLYKKYHAIEFSYMVVV